MEPACDSPNQIIDKRCLFREGKGFQGEGGEERSKKEENSATLTPL